MQLITVRLLEHLHGHLGWLTAAALWHPAIVLRRGRRKAHLAVALPTVLLTLVAAIAVPVYDVYRERLKQSVFLESMNFGYLIERKEHLAFGALMLVWAGALAYGLSFRAQEGTRESLHRLAHRAFLAAAVLSTIVAVFGTAVAVFKTF
jgi:hypothetical protein